MPASERLTMSTWTAWSSIDKLRCRIPTPPCLAIAMAIRPSVTVSIALESSGVRTVTFREIWVEVSTSLGTTSEAAGSSSTSSKVNPSGANFSGNDASMPTRLPRLEGKP